MVSVRVGPGSFVAKIEKIGDFLLELSVRDIIKADDRKQLRILYHKLSEPKEFLKIFQKDKNLQPLPQTLKTVQKINNRIEKFTTREKSLKDFIPSIELLINDLMSLLLPFTKVNKITGKPGRSKASISKP